MISIKTDEEIKIMGECGKILAHVIKEAKKISVPGTKTKYIDEFIENLIIKNKLRRYNFGL